MQTEFVSEIKKLAQKAANATEQNICADIKRLLFIDFHLYQ